MNVGYRYIPLESGIQYSEEFLRSRKQSLKTHLSHLLNNEGVSECREFFNQLADDDKIALNKTYDLIFAIYVAGRNNVAEFQRGRIEDGLDGSSWSDCKLHLLPEAACNFR